MGFGFTPANRGPEDVRLIVMHLTDGEGDAAAIRRYWDSAGIQASYHYVIERGGKVVEMVKPQNIAWHAGNFVINRDSIGVSFVGEFDRSTPNKAQQEAAIHLLARLSHEFELSLKRISEYYGGRLDPGFGVIQHNNVPGATHVDVGPWFDLRRLCAEARSTRNAVYGKLAVEKR